MYLQIRNLYFYLKVRFFEINVGQNCGFGQILDSLINILPKIESSILNNF